MSAPEGGVACSGTSVYKREAVRTLLLLLLPTAALADGVMWPRAKADELVAEKAQEAWVEHADGRQALTLAVNPGKAEPDLVWLVPLPVRGTEARLSLAESLPEWGGPEVRTAARLTLHPWMTFFFFLVAALAGAGAGEASVVIGIVFVLASISIPSFGPGPGRVGDAARVLQHQELGGLVAEVAEAGSLVAFEEYLAGKSCVLPEAAKKPVEAHILSGGAFAAAWAKDAAEDKALALKLEFPSEKPWYPVALTAAYGRKKTPIDLHLSGWWRPEGTPEGARVGYYSGERRHTRVLFEGRAEALTKDWTFSPRGASWDLRLAEAASKGSSPLLFLVLPCLLAGVLTGWAFPDWRRPAGWPRLLAFSAACLLPVLGPAIVLRRLRSAVDGVPDFPLPDGMGKDEVTALKRWGAGLMAAGYVLELGVAAAFESLPAFAAGAALCAAGVACFLRGKGYPWAAAGGLGVLTTPTFILGPLLCALPKHPKKIAAELALKSAGLPKAVPDPMPEGMDASQVRRWKLAGSAAMSVGILCQAVLAERLESGAVFLVGTALNAVGAGVFMRARGMSWAKAALSGAAASWTVLFGPLLCAFARAEAPKLPPELEPPSLSPAEVRWRWAGLAAGALAFALATGLNMAADGLWAAEDSTARVSYRGGGIVRKSIEGASRGNLQSVRAAIDAYKSAHEGRVPPDLSELTAAGKYLTEVPAAKTPYFHPDSGQVHVGDETEDRGGWLYDPKTGTLKVDCTHTDTRGNPWDSY